MSGRGVVTVEDVEQNLNLMEQVSGLVGSNDELLSAIIANQAILSTKMDMLTGGGSDGSPVGVDVQNLPLGLAGVALESIESGGVGTALFEANGNRFVAEVKPERSDVEENDYVLVNGENNSVVEGPSRLQFANSDFMGGDAGQNTVVVGGFTIRIPRVVEAGNALHLGNQAYTNGNVTDISSNLNAGESKVFSSVEVDSTQVILAKSINQSQHSTVEYRVRVDGTVDETLTGTSPLAVPPDFYEPVDGGYYSAVDTLELVIEETSGTTSYSDVESTIQAVLVDV